MQELLAFINAENARCQADVLAGRAEFDSRFGGVNCRGMNGPFGYRQDLFLPMAAPVVRKAAAELTGNLKGILEILVGPEAMLHEISCIVADPKSPRQCLHAGDCKVRPLFMPYPHPSQAQILRISAALVDQCRDYSTPFTLARFYNPFRTVSVKSSA